MTRTIHASSIPRTVLSDGWTTDGEYLYGPFGEKVRAISGAYALSSVLLVTAIVVAVASAAATYYQQEQAAQAQQRYQKGLVEAQDEAIKQNAALANEAYIRQTKALQEQQRERDESRALQEQQVSASAEAARATAQVAAGEAGVAGLSVNALIDDFTRQEAQYRFASKVSQGYEHDQTRSELEGLRAEAEGRIVTMKPYQPQPVQFPSLAGAALRAGSDSVSAYNRYRGPSSTIPTTGSSGISTSDRVRGPY